MPHPHGPVRHVLEKGKQLRLALHRCCRPRIAVDPFDVLRPSVAAAAAAAASTANNSAATKDTATNNATTNNRLQLFSFSCSRNATTSPLPLPAAARASRSTATALQGKSSFTSAEQSFGSSSTPSFPA